MTGILFRKEVPSNRIETSSVPRLVLFAAQGLSNDIIAARLDTPRQIISKWRKRFFDRRLAGLEEEPRGGRAARLSPHRRR